MGYFISDWPITGADVKRQWVAEKLEAIRRYEPKPMSAAAVRDEWYPNETDDEILNPHDGFDAAEAVEAGDSPGKAIAQARANEVELVNLKFEALMSHPPLRVLAWRAALVTAVPLMALYLGGVAVAWVIAGFRRKHRDIAG